MVDSEVSGERTLDDEGGKQEGVGLHVGAQPCGVTDMIDPQCLAFNCVFAFGAFPPADRRITWIDTLMQYSNTTKHAV